MISDQNQENKNLLIVFVKNPIIGKVKSRLASTIGEYNAFWIYSDLLERTRTAVQDLQCDKVVFYSDFIDLDDNWRNVHYKKQKQNGDNLGDRMHNAFKWGLNKHYNNIILVGSDIFYLDKEIIHNGFDELSMCDVVIGPSYDGGYYLIGLKKDNARIFEHIPWSTEEVYNKTIKVCKSESLVVKTLQLRTDIDCYEDFERLKPADRLIYEEMIQSGEVLNPDKKLP